VAGNQVLTLNINDLVIDHLVAQQPSKAVRYIMKVSMLKGLTHGEKSFHLVFRFPRLP